MRKLAIIAAICSLFAVPAASFAGGLMDEEGPGAMESGAGIFGLIGKLNLTEEQNEKLHAMREESKREVFKLHNEIRTSMWDIQDELKKDAPDRAKVDQLTDRIAAAQKRLMQIRNDHMFRIKSILTKEQFKTLVKEMDKIRKKAGKKLMKNVCGDEGMEFFHEPLFTAI